MSIKNKVLTFWKSLTNAELVVLLAIFLSRFSYWPSIGIAGERIEPAFLCGIVLISYALFNHRRLFIHSLFKSPWMAIIAFWLNSTSVALIKTDEPTRIFVQSSYFLTILLGAFVVGHLLKQGQINIRSIFKGWVFIAITLAPLLVIQFIVASFSDTQVTRETYDVGTFAFPRIHGFSFEPLFMASWLLPPLLYSYSRLKKSSSKFWLLSSAVLTLVLFLSLARGGLYAGVFGLILLSVFTQIYMRKVLCALLAGFLVAMLLIGSSAQFNDSSFKDGILRYLDHATFGAFNSEGANNIEPTLTQETPSSNTESKPKQSETFITTVAPDTEGAVEASVKGRGESIRDGLELFADSPSNVLFGVGLFRFGEEMNERKPSVYSDVNQVTNSQPVDLLVEGGLVGLVFLLIFFAYVLLNIQKIPRVLLIIALSVSLQYLFFTSYFLLPLWMLLAILVVSIQMKEVQHV